MPSFERKYISPDSSIMELGLSCNLEEATENLRSWFTRKILLPLKDDIKIVTEKFAESGLDHLSPSNPASFSLFSRPTQTSSAPNSSGAIYFSPSSFSSLPKPQTLFELGQKDPNNVMVQKRIRIERFLSFSSLMSQRVAVIRRINEMADDNLANCLRWNLSVLRPLSSTPDGGNDDVQILTQLFCSFMDENLPSDNYFESHPFSSRYFVAQDDKPSSKPEAIQLHQTSSNPPHFRLIAECKIFDTHTGFGSILHAIIYMTEYLHRHHNGFLGVGNLGSSVIDLISILNRD